MRKFTPIEINHLIKYGFDPFELEKTVDLNIPVEYITNKTDFYDRDFLISNKTLIPRIESEKLIDIALENILPNEIFFADIGSGSGVIGLTFALELKRLSMKFIGYLSDISDDALQVTKKNINNLLPEGNIIVIRSNLFENYPEIKFDIIFANLPYIPSSRINKLENSVKNYEPIVALDGGGNGLKYIDRVLNEGKRFLRKNGIIILEVDDTHTEKVALKYSNFWNIKVEKDNRGKVRHWICKSKL